MCIRWLGTRHMFACMTQDEQKNARRYDALEVEATQKTRRIRSPGRPPCAVRAPRAIVASSQVRQLDTTLHTLQGTVQYTPCHRTRPQYLPPCIYDLTRAHLHLRPLPAAHASGGSARGSAGATAAVHAPSGSFRGSAGATAGGGAAAGVVAGARQGRSRSRRRRDGSSACVSAGSALLRAPHGGGAQRVLLAMRLEIGRPRQRREAALPNAGSIPAENGAAGMHGAEHAAPSALRASASRPTFTARRAAKWYPNVCLLGPQMLLHPYQRPGVYFFHGKYHSRQERTRNTLLPPIMYNAAPCTPTFRTPPNE